MKTPSTPSTPSTPVRIAVAGAGLIGREHIARIVTCEDTELAAIVDPSPAADEQAQAHGVPRFESIDELVRRDRPDAVILATPNRLHYQQALQALAADLPALIEKPVTDDLAQGRDLLARVEAAHAQGRAGARILVGHHRTHSPIMIAAQEAIAAGAIGDVVAVSGSTLFCKPDDYFATAPWRREVGGGPILLNLIHEIHNLRMMCGEIVAVSATTANTTRGFPVEDTAAIVLSFANGALGTFILSDTVGSGRSWEQTSGENPHYARYADQDCYHIAGTMGSLSVPTMALTQFGSAASRSWSEPMTQTHIPVRRVDPLVAQLQHFAQVVRGEVSPRCTVADGVRNMAVVDAIVRSAQTGVRVDVG